MLTVDKAREAVKFVNDALRNPEWALEREEMGELHQALAPHLRNWLASGRKRFVVMVSAVGSINYNCVVESSDLDMKAVYLPSFEDLYFGSFPKYSFVTKEFDCEIHPIHHFKRHMLKGNMNFFEPVYSKTALVAPDFYILLYGTIRNLVEMNVAQTALATYFTSEQQHKGTFFSNPPFQWESKKASQAIRLLAFLINLLDTGSFDLVPREPFHTAVLRLKRGEMDQTSYIGLYEELHDAAKGMVFKKFVDGGNFEFSDRVRELDGTNTKQWENLNKELDEELMLLMRKHC